ncbi:DNA ligase 1-like [Armigeres subalbatus]|uniref:DNA ligase 1-like n=1 Tax=Armigeres subalbatus TaxID=124917 RepID=UPI002ED58389
MQSPDKTGFSCVACDRPDDAESQMVFCDHCQQWYHFGCVGVTAEVKDISWCCQKCSGGGSDDSGSSELQEELKKLEKEKKKQKRELEREKILHRKRLEVQQELFEMRQQLEKEKRDMELEFEKAQMEKKIAEEEAHQRKLDEMRMEMEEKLQQLKLKRKTETADGEKKLKGAVSGVKVGSSKSGPRKIAELEHSKLGKNLEKKKSGNKKPGKADVAIAKFNDPRGAYRKHSTPTVAQQLAPKSVGDPSTLPESFLIGRDGNSTPVGRPGVPKPEKVKRSNKWQIAEEESESETSSEEVEEEESAEEEESQEEGGLPSEEEESSPEEEEGCTEEEIRRVPKKRKGKRGHVRSKEESGKVDKVGSKNQRGRRCPLVSSCPGSCQLFLASWKNGRCSSVATRRRRRRAAFLT